MTERFDDEQKLLADAGFAEVKRLQRSGWVDWTPEERAIRHLCIALIDHMLFHNNLAEESGEEPDEGFPHLAHQPLLLASRAFVSTVIDTYGRLYLDWDERMNADNKELLMGINLGDAGDRDLFWRFVSGRNPGRLRDKRDKGESDN